MDKFQQLTSFEDACMILNRQPHLPDVSSLPEKHAKAIIAHYKLITICEAGNFLENDNQEWKPDWHNDDERKYYPWFDMDIKGYSGSGLACDGCDVVYSASFVGSRLCYKTWKLAEYIGKTFIELYKEYFLL